MSVSGPYYNWLRSRPSFLYNIVNIIRLSLCNSNIINNILETKYRKSSFINFNASKQRVSYLERLRFSLGEDVALGCDTFSILGLCPSTDKPEKKV